MPLHPRARHANGLVRRVQLRRPEPTATRAVEGDGEPRPADDVDELAWFGPDELPEEMAFSHQDELLRNWAARRR